MSLPTTDRFQRQADLVPRLPEQTATVIGVGAVGRSFAQVATKEEVAQLRAEQ